MSVNPSLDADLEAGSVNHGHERSGYRLPAIAHTNRTNAGQFQSQEQQTQDPRTGVEPIDDDWDSETEYETEEDEYDSPHKDDHAPGVLTSLLHLYNTHLEADRDLDDDDTKDTLKRSRSITRTGKSKSMVTSQPMEDEGDSDNSDADDLRSLIVKPRWYSQASMSSSVSGMTGHLKAVSEKIERRRKGEKRTIKETFEKAKSAVSNARARRKKEIAEAKITIHIADTLSKQKYLLRLSKSLLQLGAPAHRLEDYIATTARVLSIPCSMIYLPGVLVLSFNDPDTHTSDVQIVRAATSLDLGKLHHVHIIYKEVLHDVVGVQQATRRLEKIMRQPPARNVWFKVILYGLASASIGPLFDARLRDLPFTFLLGLIVALMGLVLNPKSEAFSNCFEIMSAVLVSFFARAFGSIRSEGKEVFCFSGIAQGAIAPLLLPGYIILIGALEIQSKKLVAGAVRMFYAVIYSVLLWFGISIGTALYGGFDHSATNATTCSDKNLKEYRFFFVPLFTFFVSLANQAQWKQTPAMLIISLVGYTVNYFAFQRFPQTVQVSNALSSLVIGILGNLYSRLVHQAAFSVMVPAILLQVQSGIASQGSLSAGLRVAQYIVEGPRAPKEMSQLIDGGAGELAYSLVAISIGISFGLFFSSVIVYPLGKARSSLFAF